MRRSHFLQFDDGSDDDNDVPVKLEAARGGPASTEECVLAPARSRKRKGSGAVEFADASRNAPSAPSAAAAVKVESAPEAVMGPSAFKHLCPYCSYGSDHKTKVTLHIRTHTGEKPFKVRCSFIVCNLVRCMLLCCLLDCVATLACMYGIAYHCDAGSRCVRRVLVGWQRR